MNTNTEINYGSLSITVRLSWIIIGVLVLLLLGGVVYANKKPVMHSSTHINSGLSDLPPANLKQSLRMNQTIEDTVVTLNWAYADESTIVVAYMIQTNGTDKYELKHIELTSQDGANLPLIVGTDEVLTVSGGNEYVFSFDSSTISDQPSELDLRLQIELESHQKMGSVDSFIFNFTLPLNFGLSIELNEVITASDIPITLKKVLITPSDMIATICFEEPVDDYNDWLPISFIEVSTSDTIEKSRTVTQTSLDQNGCTKSHYFPTLYNYSGNWELTITELVGFKLDTESPGQLRLAGPWIFEFDLP